MDDRRSLEDREKIRVALVARKPRAIAWALRVGLKHWHAAQWGCNGNCLKDIRFQPDLDLVLPEKPHKKIFKVPPSLKPGERARRASAKSRKTTARRKRVEEEMLP